MHGASARAKTAIRQGEKADDFKKLLNMVSNLFYSTAAGIQLPHCEHDVPLTYRVGRTAIFKLLVVSLRDCNHRAACANSICG
jgi:hypothetical protein